MECYIVEALLKNYKDGLTSEGTNRDIEEHLKICKSCQMKLDKIENDCPQEDKKQNKKQVTYLLKMRKTIKILAVVVASVGWIIILCIIGIYIYTRFMV